MIYTKGIFFFDIKEDLNIEWNFFQMKLSVWPIGQGSMENFRSYGQTSTNRK